MTKNKTKGDESLDIRRQQALDLLTDKGGQALSEVEEIVGFGDRTCVFRSELAGRLGISENRLR